MARLNYSRQTYTLSELTHTGWLKLSLLAKEWGVVDYFIDLCERTNAKEDLVLIIRKEMRKYIRDQKIMRDGK